MPRLPEIDVTPEPAPILPAWAIGWLDEIAAAVGGAALIGTQILWFCGYGA